MAEALTEVVKYLEERAKNIQKFSDKLRNALKEIDSYFEGIGKEAGVEFVDTEPIMTYWDLGSKVELRLAVRKEGGYWGLAVVEWDSPSGYFRGWIGEVSRKVMKAAVKRLPTFIRLYAEELAKQEKEIADFAEKAEKIASLLA